MSSLLDSIPTWAVAVLVLLAYAAGAINQERIKKAGRRRNLEDLHGWVHDQEGRPRHGSPESLGAAAQDIWREAMNRDS